MCVFFLNSSEEKSSQGMHAVDFVSGPNLKTLNTLYPNSPVALRLGTLPDKDTGQNP